MSAEESDFFEGADDPTYPEDSKCFEDPFAPRRPVYSHNSVFPSCDFCHQPRILPGRPRPYVQHILRANSQITSVRHFSSTDGPSLLLGCLNAIHYITNWSKLETSVLFDPKELSIVELIDVHPSEVYCACNGPSRNVRICSLVSGSPVCDINSHRGHVTGLFFAPSFNRIGSSSLDGTLLFSDVITQKLVFNYRRFEGVKAISTVKMRFDETVVALGTDDGMMELFDQRVGQVTEVKSHAGWVNSIDFCVSEALLASAGIDRSVRVWDLRQLSEPLLVERGISFGIKEVLFASDKSCFAVGNDGCILRMSTTRIPSSIPMIVKPIGIVSADMCGESNRLAFSTEDMGLSTLVFDPELS
jgi:WD40 repeat protein